VEMLLRPILLAFALVWRFASLCHKAWLTYCVRHEQVPTLKMIVVGSLRIGGGGKTPMAAWLAKEKARQGLRVCILCYAVYKAPFQILNLVSPDSDWRSSSDEAVWLACTCDVPVFATRNRWEAWKQLANRHEFDLIISDDGFEDPRLHKAVRLLLDWGEPGNSIREIFPAGACRSLRKDHVAAILVPMFANRLLIQSVHNCDGKNLSQESVWLLSAIGDPNRLRTDLQAFGVRILGVTQKRDHAIDVSKEALRILSKQPHPLILTEKDWIKLDHDLQQHPRIFVVHQYVNVHGLRPILAIV